LPQGLGIKNESYSQKNSHRYSQYLSLLCPKASVPSQPPLAFWLFGFVGDSETKPPVPEPHTLNFECKTRIRQMIHQQITASQASTINNNTSLALKKFVFFEF
jgi:hypothetical protein